MSTIHQLDLKGGTIRGSADLDFDLPLEAQEDSLVEDICQICFGNITIDVGWYPEDLVVLPESYFGMTIIRDGDWERPIESYSCYRLTDLKETLETLISRYSHTQTRGERSGKAQYQDTQQPVRHSLSNTLVGARVKLTGTGRIRNLANRQTRSKKNYSIPTKSPNP